MSEADGSLDHRAERTLVSMAVLIAAQLSSSRNARTHAFASRMLEKAGSAPTYFRKGFSGARAGRIVVRSFSTTNSTRSPALSPRRLRTSRGTVICPLLLIELKRAIFTFLLYSKDSMFYMLDENGDPRTCRTLGKRSVYARFSRKAAARLPHPES